MFQRVGQAGLTGRLLQRAESVPHAGLNHRSRVILDDDYSQSIKQRRREDSGIARATLRRRGLRRKKCKQQRKQPLDYASLRSASVRTGCVKKPQSVVTPK
jgi:hypothetical protein